MFVGVGDEIIDVRERKNNDRFCLVAIIFKRTGE